MALLKNFGKAIMILDIIIFHALLLYSIYVSRPLFTMPSYASNRLPHSLSSIQSIMVDIFAPILIIFIPVFLVGLLAYLVGRRKKKGWKKKS